MFNEENLKITDIKAEQILDSRNNPTLKVSVYCNELEGIFLVPSGKSTGKYEACELRDDEKSNSNVSKAIQQIETKIKPKLIGLNPLDQKKIDEIMINLDGTESKSILGGNSMIGVSIATAKLSAKILNLPVYEYLSKLENVIKPNKIPLLYFNLINGGGHAKTKIAFQEYHIVPQVENIKESVYICQQIQDKLSQLIMNQYGTIADKGDEGGFVLTDVSDVTEPLKLLNEAIIDLNYQEKVKMALDVAASSFYDKENDSYNFMNKSFSKLEFIEFYEKICQNFSLISIEDPLQEEDFEGFAQLQNKLYKTKIIGDDLTVTNEKRLKKAITSKSIQGLIIKPNQIGTLSETIKTIKLAHENNINCIISHRSGETMDDFIADLVYAFGCFGIKSGAWGPKERNVKYEKLISITN